MSTPTRAPYDLISSQSGSAGSLGTNSTSGLPAPTAPIAQFEAPSSYRSIPIPGPIRSPRSRTHLYGSPRSPGGLSGFVGSYQRAQSFRSLEPRMRAVRSYFQDDEELIDPRTLAPSQMGRKISTVLAQPSRPHFDVVDVSADEAAVLDDSSVADQSFADYLQDSALSSARPSISRSQSLARIITNETESLLIRRVDTTAGMKVTMMAPRSTVAQTIFNSINALIGVGLLALSKAMIYSGWVPGCIMLTYSVIVTYWTATLLSKCMDTDPTLCTYADLGYKAYGAKARLFVSILFSVELLGVGVSLYVLFADSFNALFPSISVTQFKFIAFCVLTPLSFLSLRVLSSISLLGITGTISLVALIIAIGLAKQTSPGSLVDPAPTSLFPPSWTALFMSYGIILGPFGSHSLFPAIKADLATPQKFESCLKITYSVGFIADSTMAFVGFAMFGAGILSEITKSVLLTKGYPRIVYALTSILVSFIPIAKTPINALPIINIAEYMLGLTEQQLAAESRKPSFRERLTKFLIRPGVNAMFCLCAILYPEFDKIIGLSGASLCTLICIVLPCGFYVRICHPTNTFFYHTVMVVATILGALSTYAAIIS